MEKIINLVSQLTLKEKIELVSGYKSWNTNEIKRLNIPSIYMTDGPIGLRKKIDDPKDKYGLGGSYPSTSFPTSVNIANSFNDENAFKMGEAIGEECEAYNVNIILGPAMNIKRDPRCGRNFEYYSEDPIVAGNMASSFTKGVQSRNVAACMKHYAINNSENYRYMGSSVLDIRAAREIYLKPYEICVKNANPKSAMCGYNKVNGTHCSENKWLITDMLRNTFNFDGIVMTDWGATKDRVLGIKAGIDLDMPGDIKHNKKEILDAINDGRLSLDELDACVTRILKLVYSFNQNKQFDNKQLKQLLKSHEQLALDIAIDSAVLLKNDDNILPLNKDKKVLVVGELFEKMRYQGSGSSCMNPSSLINPLKAFDDNNVKYEYEKGYKENTDLVDIELEERAINKAKEYDTVLFFGGLTELFESEGYDREDLCLPNNQISLINKLTNITNVVFVSFGGSPFEVPFINEIKAMLNMFLPGQEGGMATYNLLYGINNPSGKLSETWVKKTSDIYFSDEFSKHHIEKYKENIYVGYRFYNENIDRVLFPFGYGLSYTKFKYSKLKVKKDDNNYTVSFKIKNIGKTSGSEVAQLYVSNNKNSKVFKANKSLLSYKKVYLNPNEEKEIELNFNEKDLGYYNDKISDFVVENGTYRIEISSSSINVELQDEIKVKGYEEVDTPYDKEVIETYKNVKELEKISDDLFIKTLDNVSIEEPLKLPFTMETPIEDFKQTKSGKFVYDLILKIIGSQTRPPKNETNQTKIDQINKNNRFALVLIPKNSLRSLCQSSGGVLQYNLARALLDIANGHPLKAIGKALKNEKF